MATAAKTPGRSASPVPPQADGSAPELAVFPDNGGRYRWEIRASDGERLAVSDSFASEPEARDAAQRAWTAAAGAGAPVDA